jgi:hypothetical protein
MAMNLPICLLLLGAAGGDIGDPAGPEVAAEPRTSLQFSVAYTVLIEVDTGESAVVTFAAVTDETATYRWKYRGSPGGPVGAGTGRLRERYKHVAWRWTWTWPIWKALSEEVAPLPDNETTVRAGGIHIGWSARARGEGYLYYPPGHVTIRLLPGPEFEKWR